MIGLSILNIFTKNIKTHIYMNFNNHKKKKIYVLISNLMFKNILIKYKIKYFLHIFF